MAKRLREPSGEESAKRHKTDAQTSANKRPLECMPHTPEKRRKIFEYWHTQPHTREERAAYMATIYEHLLCR